MNKGIDTLAWQLLQNIYSATLLKQVSDYLEDLSQNKVFKEHATAIATDTSLTHTQKKTQLSYLFRSVELPLLYQFFLHQFDTNQFWLFSGGRIDYFDRLVMAFQKQTELLQIVYVETAVKLTMTQVKAIATNLTEAFGVKVVVHEETVPHLVGGLKIKIDNLVYDYSLHTKYLQFQRVWIQTLKETDKLIGRHVPEVETGSETPE